MADIEVVLPGMVDDNFCSFKKTKEVKQMRKEIFDWFYQIKKNSANFITGVGVIFAIWLNVKVWQGSADYWLALWLIILVGLSDLFDGLVARRFSGESQLGSFADKLRDKIFACPLFLFILVELWRSGSSGFLTALVLAILVNELILLFVWLYSLFLKKGILSHWFGRVKMFFYFWSIGWWLLGKISGSSATEWLGIGLVIFLYLAWLFGFLRIIQYWQAIGGQPSRGSP